MLSRSIVDSVSKRRGRTGSETTLYSELIRRGLPADYAQRTADELDDHRADLLADLRREKASDPEATVNERLGETRKLAKKIAGDYRRRTWLGRWPLLSFLLAPPLLLNLAWTAVIAGIAGLSSLALWLLGDGSPTEYTAGRNIESAYAFYYFALIVFSFAIPGALAWWYGRLALSTTQSRAYVVIACLSFGMMNGLVHHQVWPDPDNAERALNGFGAPIPYVLEPLTLLGFYAQPMQSAQVLAPLAAGCLLLLQDRCRRREALLAPHDVMVDRALAA